MELPQDLEVDKTNSFLSHVYPARQNPLVSKPSTNFRVRTFLAL